jgi:transcription initiation factor IIF auxiliary subunit
VWTVYLTGPRDRLHEVASVTYELHWTFTPSTVEISAHAEAGFPLSQFGWGVFDLKATVRFKDRARAPLNLVHRLRLSE